MRFRGRFAPAENRFEMMCKGEIGERHRIGRIKRDGFLKQPARLRQI